MKSARSPTAYHKPHTPAVLNRLEKEGLVMLRTRLNGKGHIHPIRGQLPKWGNKPVHCGSCGFTVYVTARKHKALKEDRVRSFCKCGELLAVNDTVDVVDVDELFAVFD